MRLLMILLLLISCGILSAAAPLPPAWSTGTVTTVNINGTNRYQCEANWGGQTWYFWYIDIADAATSGQVDLGTRVQYSLRTNIPRLGAEPRATRGQKNGGWDGDYAYEYHPEGQNIWRSTYGWQVYELYYKRPRPQYMLTDGVESIISGVRAYEFHLDALEFFMGEAPRGELNADVPNYSSHPNAGPVSGIPLRPLTVTLSRSYWMLQNEVSQVQWNALMGAQPPHWPAAPVNDGYANYLWNAASDNPVAFITTGNARDFIDQVNAQAGVAGNCELPTEAEWEYACRIPDRAVPSTNSAAAERGMSQQDLPFAYGMHLFDPMLFYFGFAPVAGVELRIGRNKQAPANSFHAIFDFRYTFSYNLPTWRPSTPLDPDDIDNVAHYIRGYANHEPNHPIAPGDLSGGKIVNGSTQNHWGLYHMHGNVAEIVRDVWDGASPHDESYSATGAADYFVDMSGGAAWKMKYHPVKGGSWMSGGSQCRASARGKLLKHDSVVSYPRLNADGTVDGTQPDDRCYSDTVGMRVIIYE